MKKFIFPLVLIFLLLSTCFSQTEADKKKAHNLGKQAIKLEEKEGKYDEAITLFKQAQQLDPENIDYSYEIAYAYYLKKDYAASIEQANNLLNHKDVKDEAYRLLGNSYDMTGDPEKALETYNNGLTVFPNSGKLYHEIGILYANKDSAEPAIENWELGIKADPTFASNYYELTKVFCSSTERVWGVIYGELFLNIERNSDRCYEISKLLYDTYKAAITINVDKSGKKTGQVSFSKVSNLAPTTNKLRFETAFELTMVPAIASTDKISLKELYSLRKFYIESWWKLKRNLEYPNTHI